SPTGSNSDSDRPIGWTSYPDSRINSFIYYCARKLWTARLFGRWCSRRMLPLSNIRKLSFSPSIGSRYSDLFGPWPHELVSYRSRVCDASYVILNYAKSRHKLKGVAVRDVHGLVPNYWR